MLRETTVVSNLEIFVIEFNFGKRLIKRAYLVRKYFFSNLHDRLSTRPFLRLVEKKWLAFQVFFSQCHEKGICHIVMTSPFFDTREGTVLNILSLLFTYEHGGETQVVQDSPLKPSMDIFSVGCVIAEIFLEGQPLFELAQLLAYRRGQHDPSQHLEKIPDPGIRNMILHMIQLEPEARLSAENYLQNYVATCHGIFQERRKKMSENNPGDEAFANQKLNTWKDS
ncbi:BnaC07g50760D [Brassica napus]|uniref:(rape) hypothetical protein n=1 Tax=Brassica napus TaxID=3708 RepID=A0A078IY54_BRANA|nr:unnamed protein product [Brassica napus]CDY54274.1 BnaC07g50760D [Brassica napus]